MSKVNDLKLTPYEVRILWATVDMAVDEGFREFKSHGILRKDGQRKRSLKYISDVAEEELQELYTLQAISERLLLMIEPPIELAQQSAPKPKNQDEGTWRFV